MWSFVTEAVETNTGGLILGFLDKLKLLSAAQTTADIFDYLLRQFNYLTSKPQKYLNSCNSNIGLGGHYAPREINETEKDKYYMLSHVESKKYNKLVNMTKK